MVMAQIWGPPLLPPLCERLCRGPQKLQSVLPMLVSCTLTASGCARSPPAPSTSRNKIPHHKQVAAPSALISLVAEQRHHLTFVKGLETPRGCKEIPGEVPSPVKGHCSPVIAAALG